MILLGRKMIGEFGKAHPPSRKPLSAWEKVIDRSDYSSFNTLKRAFPSADYVSHRYTIFNLGGNKYRLISEIDYGSKIVNVKRIWTHAAYSMKKNIEALRRGKL